MDPGIIGVISEEMLKNEAVWYLACRSVAEEQKSKQASFELIKRHTEEESLLASPVKTWLSLANSKCPSLIYAVTPWDKSIM